jgi:hypothetical protein
VLRDSINTVENLLQGDVVWSGTSRLVTPVQEIIDGLFAIPTDSVVEVQVVDIKNSIYETTTNISDFWNFEDLTFESLVGSLSDAILGTQDWDNGGDEALAPLNLSLDETWQLHQDRIAETIQESLDEFEPADGQQRRVVQDMERFVETIEVLGASGVFDFTSKLAYAVTDGVLEFSSNIARHFDQAIQVELGLGFESLYSATENELIQDTPDLIGPLGSTQATMTTSLQLGLEFDPSVGNQPQSASRGFVSSQSRLDRAVYINALALLG